MKVLQLFLVLSLTLMVSAAGAADGLIAVKSPYNAKDTMDRFEAVVKERGLNVFARINHAAGADGRHRPAVESPSLAGRLLPSLAWLQRSGISRETPQCC